MKFGNQLFQSVVRFNENCVKTMSILYSNNATAIFSPKNIK